MLSGWMAKNRGKLRPGDDKTKSEQKKHGKSHQAKLAAEKTI